MRASSSDRIPSFPLALVAKIDADLPQKKKRKKIEKIRVFVVVVVNLPKFSSDYWKLS